MMPVVILCGGKGTRLGDLTARTPKSLVTIHGEPFLVHQLRLLEGGGITEVYLLVGHLGARFLEAGLEDRFPALHIRYIFDGDTLLGTAGAIRAAQARAYLPSEFFTLYGDSYLECDYPSVARAFWHCGKPALMTSWNGIDYGLSAFHWSAFSVGLPVGVAWDLPWLHRRLEFLGELHVLPMPVPFREMGSTHGLASLAAHLA